MVANVFNPRSTPATISGFPLIIGKDVLVGEKLSLWKGIARINPFLNPLRSVPRLGIYPFSIRAVKRSESFNWKE